MMLKRLAPQAVALRPGLSPARNLVGVPVSAWLNYQGFTRDTISGLVTWLKADALAQADGTAVASWTDSSMSANHFIQATGAKQPTFKTAIVGGRPVVRFDGVDDGLASAASVDLSASTGLTVFVVMSATSGSDRAIAEMSTDTNGQTDSWILHRAASDKVGSYHKGVAPSVFESTRTLTTTPRIAVATMDRTLSSAESTVWVDGDSAGSRFLDGDITGTFGNRTVYMGARAGTSLFLAGDVAEFGIYNRALSTGERTTLQNYLSAKYGIPIA